MPMTRKLIFGLVISGGGLIFGLLLSVIIFSPQVDSWLSASSPVSADILVVEGWVFGQSLEAAKEEFLEGRYNLLITTGGPLDAAFNMSQNGYLEFDLNSAGVSWNDNNSVSVALFAFGEPVEGVFARYTITHNDDTIGRGYTEAGLKRYVYSYDVNDIQAEKIKVIFDNDHYAGTEDRNLHVLEIEINDVIVPGRSEYTKYVRRQDGNIIERPLYHESLAEEKAWSLSRSGIDSNLIVPLKVPEARLFRTYTDAVAVSEWIRNTDLSNVSVNIFTEGNHARRSHTLYRYALPDSVKVGVVGTERSGFYQADRLDFAFGRLNTLRQLSAYIYTRVFFNQRWHYRRIANRLRKIDGFGS